MSQIVNDRNHGGFLLSRIKGLYNCILDAAFMGSHCL